MFHNAKPPSHREESTAGWSRRLWLQIGPRSWWVWTFALLCALGYQMTSQRQQLLLHDLSDRYSALQQQRERALQRQEELLAQIGSQADPAWIEQVLMKALGVSPEGQIKVYFQGEEQ